MITIDFALFAPDREDEEDIIVISFTMSTNREEMLSRPERDLEGRSIILVPWGHN
jgi:hypothetical protein